MKRLLMALALVLAAGDGRAATVVDITIDQGATFTKAWKTNRVLTGCTLAMEIRDAPGGQLLAAPLPTTTSASRGEFTTALTADQTGQLNFTVTAVYDIEATCSSTVYRLFEGHATLDLGVTTDEVAPGSFPAPGTPPGELYVRKSGGEVVVDAANDGLKLTANVDRHMAIFRRYNNTTGDACWNNGTWFNSQGAYHSNAWLIVSGTMTGPPDADGVCALDPGATDPFMVAVYGDVVGPSYSSRMANIAPTGWHFQGIDHTGKYRIVIDEDGRINWGLGATHTDTDASLFRDAAGALRTNATLAIDGGSGGRALKLSDDGSATFAINASGQSRAWRFQSYDVCDFNGGGNWYSNGIVEIKDGGRITTPSPGGTGINIGMAAEKLGFYGATPSSKRTVTGSRGGNAALASLLTALAAEGLITDSTTP